MVEGLKLLKKQQQGDRRACEKLGLKLDYDFNGEAYQTVSGQNSNNSVRIPDSFFDALDQDATGDHSRTNGKVAKTFKARKLWDEIGLRRVAVRRPGRAVRHHDQRVAHLPERGRINASNPCSEYMFLDNTACNLASLNVLKFYDARRASSTSSATSTAIDLWTIVLEISVLMAAFPSKEIAELSYKYRTLGLGYANLGAMLMQAGIPYDSEEAAAICAMLTAILTGRSTA
jgi:ribonucleoside-diphosphate reductase alpha chain